MMWWSKLYTSNFWPPTMKQYEALIAGIKVMREVGAQNLKVFSDSQLVVGQIKGGYEAREKNMKRYFQKVKDLILSFLSFDI